MPSKESVPAGEVLLYQTEDGSTRIDVRLQDETVWLTQAQMAELFQTTKHAFSQVCMWLLSQIYPSLDLLILVMLVLLLLVVLL